MSIIGCNLVPTGLRRMAGCSEDLWEVGSRDGSALMGGGSLAWLVSIQHSEPWPPHSPVHPGRQEHRPLTGSQPSAFWQVHFRLQPTS